MGRVSRMFFFFLTITCGTFLFYGSAIAEDGLKFPLREKYPKLATIDSNSLAAVYDKAIVVDSRNKMEFDVVRMKGAHNILVGRMSEGDLLALRKKDDSKAPLVFYCNGTTCAKSYKAAEAAEEMGFKNVKVYDPGIFHWAQKKPHLTEFFGELMTSETVKTSFISKEKFESTLIDTKTFIEKAKGGGYIVIDGRDFEEKSEIPIDMEHPRLMSLDLMASLLQRNSFAMPRENLLVFDNVGKQVSWLQYYFEKYGVKNYFFLKGGVRQWKADGYDKMGSKK